jgi:hypothetical protein
MRAKAVSVSYKTYLFENQGDVADSFAYESLFTGTVVSKPSHTQVLKFFEFGNWGPNSFDMDPDTSAGGGTDDDVVTNEDTGERDPSTNAADNDTNGSSADPDYPNAADDDDILGTSGDPDVSNITDEHALAPTGGPSAGLTVLTGLDWDFI